MANWDVLAAGIDCPFDPPRVEPNDYWDSVTQLQVSTLCLLRNQAYRGHCILIYDLKHVVRPDQLGGDEWLSFCHDVHTAVRALMTICRPDHINVECLGNQLPHLHWHIISEIQDESPMARPDLDEYD